MAKRPRGGARGSKPGQRGSAAATAKTDRPAIGRKMDGSRRNHTVRLSRTEERRLQGLLNRTIEETGRMISEADLMRGLLVLGEKAETLALVDAIRHARFDVE